MIEFNGQTMGGAWQVRLAQLPLDPDALLNRLQRRLDALDLSLSTWTTESGLMRLNATPVGIWVDVERDLFDVAALSQNMMSLTDHAFDPFMGAEIQAAGFSGGHAAGDGAIGTPHGTAPLSFDATRMRMRRNTENWLDLSAIAKGFAADRLLGLLCDHGFHDACVEVAGDLAVRGTQAGGRPWSVSVELPVPDRRILYRDVQVHGGIATSGNTRNLREFRDETVTHLFDPVTRTPLRRSVSSVTVMADCAAKADALATALFVMGRNGALTFANRNGLAIIYLDACDGGLREFSTGAFSFDAVPRESSKITR
ncbi:FAD:protein FMN transferase [Pacificibacter sp. AS14]|uniref:FAD:protein FMN transferase n=1 Tax=Pacificibacter sp. AS14 TaxID=3135785 RepID=UPI00318099B3